MTESEFVQKASENGIVFTRKIAPNGSRAYFVDKDMAGLWEDVEYLKADIECLKTEHQKSIAKIKEQEVEIEILCSRIQTKGPVRVTRFGKIAVEIYRGEG